MESLGEVVGPAKEINEVGVSTITMDNGYENEHYCPDRGEVKWFRDEFEQIWVKFYTTSFADTPVRHTVCQVWPGSRVVTVEYDKSTPPKT